MTDNLLEGNDGSGIQFYAQMDGCSDIDVRDNIARNNTGYGIEVSQAVGGVLQNNTALDNRRTEQIHVVSSKQITQK
ncbi:MAG: parallel beta-helix repeat protein [Candidatus Latescibacterota bacterium]